MKLSEIARYWAAKELTHFDVNGSLVTRHAPFATPAFTVDLTRPGARKAQRIVQGQAMPPKKVSRALDLVSGTWYRRGDGLTGCFGLPKGTVLLETEYKCHNTERSTSEDMRAVETVRAGQAGSRTTSVVSRTIEWPTTAWASASSAPSRQTSDSD